MPTIREFRANLSQIINDLPETGPVQITNHGKTVATLVPVGKTVTAINSSWPTKEDFTQAVTVPPNPKPLKPYQSPSKLVSNTDLERSFTYRPVPKPGTKK